MLTVRTQDRMALVPYNNTIEIYESRKRTELKEWELTGICEITLGNVPLGTYSSKERALEVLYEIETAIEKNNFTNYEYFDGYIEKVVEYKYKLQTIYQMPKE